MLRVAGESLPELHTPGKHAGGEALCFAAHGTRSPCYWAQPHEVVREATAEDLRRRDEQARPRGVACDDPECWCREALRGA